MFSVLINGKESQVLAPATAIHSLFNSTIQEHSYTLLSALDPTHSYVTLNTAIRDDYLA